MPVAGATETQLNAARAAVVALEKGLQRAVQGDKPILAAELQEQVDAVVDALGPLEAE